MNRITRISLPSQPLHHYIPILLSDGVLMLCRYPVSNEAAYSRSSEQSGCQLQYPRYVWNWYLTNSRIPVTMYTVFKHCLKYVHETWGIFQTVAKQVKGAMFKLCCLNTTIPRVGDTTNIQPFHGGLQTLTSVPAPYSMEFCNSLIR